MGGESIVPGGFYIPRWPSRWGAGCRSRSSMWSTRASWSSRRVTLRRWCRSLTLKEEQDGVRSFVTHSCSSRDKHGEQHVQVEHCVG